MEAVRIVDRNAASAPRLVGGLGGECVAAGLDARGERVDVLHRRAPDAHGDAAVAIAPLLPVVLCEADAAHAGLQHDALQRAVLVGVALLGDEAERAGVEADAALDVADGEDWLDRAEAQRFE